TICKSVLQTPAPPIRTMTSFGSWTLGCERTPCLLWVVICRSATSKLPGWTRVWRECWRFRYDSCEMLIAIPPGRQSAEEQHQSVSSLAWAVLLTILLFIAYNSNLRVIRFDDTVPARFLPFSLLLDHSLYLDKWVEPYVIRAQGPNGVYFVARFRGHWVS